MRTVLRAGLLGFAAVELVLGLWTIALPESFYADVPTVDLTPPFSEHLMRDFGGATLGLALVLAAAGIWLERRLVVVALLAHLAFSVPHLVFHVGHLDGASDLEAAVLVVLLAASVAVPAGLLAVALRLPGASAPAPVVEG
jgi:predicted permease